MNTFVKVLKVISVFSLAAFILLGVLAVLIQAVGIVTLNGALAASVGTVKNLSIAFAGAVGVGSFILSYFKKAK